MRLFYSGHGWSCCEVVLFRTWVVMLWGCSIQDMGGHVVRLFYSGHGWSCCEVVLFRTWVVML